MAFENQNPLDNDCGTRLDAYHVVPAAIVRKVVRRALDGLPFAQPPDVLRQQRRVHRIRMIEVLLRAFFEGEFGEGLVVVVLLEHHDVRFGDGFDNPARDRRLSRAGAPANSDNQRTAIERSNRQPPSSPCASWPSSPQSPPALPPAARWVRRTGSRSHSPCPPGGRTSRFRPRRRARRRFPPLASAASRVRA